MVRGDNAKVHAFYQSLGYFEQNASSSPNGSTAASRRRDRKARMTISDRIRVKTSACSPTITTC